MLVDPTASSPCTSGRPHTPRVPGASATHDVKTVAAKYPDSKEAPLKRSRSCPSLGNDLEGLVGYDWSVGLLAPYLKVCRERFASPEQIVELYVHKNTSGVIRLDPQLFEELGMTDLHHRAIFECWFLKPVQSARPVPRRARSSGAPVPTRSQAGLHEGRLGIDAWLEKLERGRGSMTQIYGEALRGSFNSAAEVAEAYVTEDRGLDVKFFEDFDVKKIGHRRLFERWFRESASMGASSGLARGGC